MASTNKQYKTQQLLPRVLVDLVAAGAAGASIAPVVTAIDRAIIENASGNDSLRVSLTKSIKTALRRPHHYILSRPFALIYTVYASTYIAANFVDTFLSTVKNKPLAFQSSGGLKFLSTSTTNLALSVWKDINLAKLFGSSAAPGRMPPIAIAAFATRDAMTIAASFNIPPRLAPMLPLSDGFQRKYFTAASAAQCISPVAIQLFSTPFHLYAIDVYNSPERANGAAGVKARLDRVRHNWLHSSFARMARILPAFGFGGVINTSVRKSLMAKLEPSA